MYNIALLLHIISVVAILIAVGVELAGLWGMRSAAATDVRTRIATVQRVERVTPVAGVVLLITGLYMMHEKFSSRPAWTVVGLIVLIAVAGLDSAVNAPRLKAIAAAAGDGGQASVGADLSTVIHDRVLWTSVLAMATSVIGVIGLMSSKPSTAGSIITIVVAVAIGVGLAQLLSRDTTGAAAH